ncbi:unnamed protein product [Protopolystoma xenopodis]|uniref:Uncharacterized protein n=1 Tax=Protopolystoma xenopodis TaxID=117903 RepID=A0A448WL26_9PLAT|nr:unnamed protein product [Protopolystoma xenopodis]
MPLIVPGVLIQGYGLIRNPLSSGPIRVPSCSIGSFPYLSVSVIPPHRCHRIPVTQGVMFCTLPQAFDSKYTPASLSKPLKSGFSFDKAM